MTHGTSEWIRAARHKLSVVEEQYSRCLQAEDAISRLRRRLSERLPGGMENLLDQLLSAGVLTPEGVRGAARQVECTDLYDFDPPAEMERARAALNAERAEIEADEGFARIKTELPQLLERADAKKAELAEPQAFLDRARHERLELLLENGYGTEDYDTAWWRLSYYSDWEAGDEILEAFGGEFEEFAEFARAYRAMSNLYGRLKSEQEELLESVEHLRALDQRHFSLGQRLAAVPKEVGERVRETLEAHVARLGIVSLRGVSEESRVAACNWVGVGKQLGYLDELGRNMLEPFTARMRKDVDKLRRKIAKYNRPKHRGTRFSPAEFQSTFADRSAKYAKFWDRFDAAFAAIHDFERYEYGRLDDDFLWWDLMGEGRVKNRFSPEVEEFYEEHPDYYWDSPWTDDDDDEAAAAAAVAGADDGGMSWDAS